MESRRELLVVSCLLVSALAINPGFKTRITDSGLNYAAKVGLEVLGGYINGASLPDQHGGGSGFSYDITAMKVNGFSAPNGVINVVPGTGLSWGASGGGLGVHGNWHYSALFISDSGSFDASISNLGFALSVVFGEDSTGRPKIGSGSCNCNIGNLNIQFHGGASAIYNLFSGLVANELKGQIQSQICGTIANEINTDAEKALSNIPVQVEIADLFLLDYRLVQAPQFTAKFMETSHKGEIFWKTNKTAEAPIPCPTMPEASSASKMVYLWVSDYLFDTLGYTAQKNNFLMYNLTANDLPPDSKSVLNTTCSGLKCIGNFIPEIGKKYPNSQVELHMNSTRVPDMMIDPSNAILNCGGKIDLYARTPDKKLAYLCSLNATMAGTVDLSVTNETIHGKILDVDLKLKVLKSEVGNIPNAALQFVIDAALKIYLIPTLNNIGQKGFPLPVIEGVTFRNTALTLAKDTVIVDTDINYKTTHAHKEYQGVDRQHKPVNPPYKTPGRGIKPAVQVVSGKFQNLL